MCLSDNECLQSNPFPAMLRELFLTPFLLRYTNNLHTIQPQGMCIPFLLILHWLLPQARSKCRISVSLWLPHILFPAPTTDKLFPPSPLRPGHTLPANPLSSKDVDTHPGADCLHHPRKPSISWFLPGAVSPSTSVPLTASNTAPATPQPHFPASPASLHPLLQPPSHACGPLKGFWCPSDALLAFQPCCCYIRLGAGCMSHPWAHNGCCICLRSLYSQSLHQCFVKPFGILGMWKKL